jgi:hypothetical protein
MPGQFHQDHKLHCLERDDPSPNCREFETNFWTRCFLCLRRRTLDGFAPATVAYVHVFE